MNRGKIVYHPDLGVWSVKPWGFRVPPRKFKDFEKAVAYYRQVCCV